MGVKVIAAVLELEPSEALSASARLSLVVLANRANDRTGRCWPGIREIMTGTGLSERTVRGILRALESAGYIETASRHTPTGRQTTNSYRLTQRVMPWLNAADQAADEDGEPEQGEGAESAPTPPTDAPEQGGEGAVGCRGEGATDCPLVSLNHQKEPPPPEESNLQFGESAGGADAHGDDGGGGDGEVGEQKGRSNDGPKPEGTSETADTRTLQPSAPSLQPASLGPAARLTALGVASEDRIREIIGRNTVEAIHAACDAFEQALAEGSRLTPGKLVDALTGGAPIRTRKGAGSAVGPDSASRAPAGAEHVYRCEVCGQGWRLAVPPAARPTCRVDGCEGRYAAMTHVRAEHPPP